MTKHDFATLDTHALERLVAAYRAAKADVTIMTILESISQTWEAIGRPCGNLPHVGLKDLPPPPGAAEAKLKLVADLRAARL